jgi:hypothetical protein
MSFCTGRACLRQSRDGHLARRSQKVPIWSGRTCTQAALRRDRRSVWIVITEPRFGRRSERSAASPAIAAHRTAGEPYEEAGTLSANFSRGLAEVDQLGRIAPISTSRASFARRRSCTVGSWTTRRCPRSIRAVEIGSGHFGWYMRLARALERSGQRRVALSYRRHAQRLDPAFRANAVAIGDALATLDGRLGAADHYQRLTKRWPRDPGVCPPPCARPAACRSGGDWGEVRCGSAGKLRHQGVCHP